MSGSSSSSKAPVTMNIYEESPVPSIKNERLKFTSSTPFVPTFVTSSVTQSSDPQEIYASRIHGRKILLENQVKESRAKKERESRKARRKVERDKKKLGVIGRKEAMRRGIWRLDPAQAKFNLFVPLHHLWMGYMSELLGLRLAPSSSSSSAGPSPPSMKDVPSSAGMHAKLLKADFHGSIITVRQSKCPSLIGLSGIVIHETENAFTVVTRQDKAKLIPKQNSIFAFSVPIYSTLPPSHTPDSPLPLPLPPPDSHSQSTVLDGPHLEFELYGNQFRFRSADRAARKFKPKETIEL